VPSCCGKFHGAFYVMLAFDFAEIEILVGGTLRLPVVRRPIRLENFFATEEFYDLREA
jgi:hypothetical protein